LTEEVKQKLETMTKKEKMHFMKEKFKAVKKDF